MKFKKIHFIVNPAAGKDEPIMGYIEKAFRGSSIDWAYTVTQEEKDVFETAKRLVGRTDLIAVYGGDGTVAQVARALQGSTTPMAIVPGGTANVLSKELGLPQDSAEVLSLIATGKIALQTIDMGSANGCPFLLRINLGIMADMVLSASHELKEKIGQAAYGVSALKTLAAAEPVEYKLLIDGVEIIETGVALTVTNAGNVGIGHLSFLPGISVSDGWLDVLLLPSASPLAMLKVAGSTLFQTDSNVLKHWRCRRIQIETKESVKYICDDYEASANRIIIKIVPLALKVVIPSDDV